MRQKLFFPFIILVIGFLVACQTGQAPASNAPQYSPTPGISTSLPIATRKPGFTPTPILPTPSASPTPPGFTNLCSPLEGEPLATLNRPDLLKNPFQAPRPGDDGGHHGIDLAYWSRPDGSSMLGLPVQSVVDGFVAGVINNRPPYGNAILIETPLELIPPAWQQALPFSSFHSNSPLIPPISLTCPKYPDPPAARSASLYLLYAHLQEAPTLTTGEVVSCGQTIGKVGTSGKSVNPHLHLETRIGPAGISFRSMAHYDNTATEDEMLTYCLWRLSGEFQPFDPLLLLSLPSP
ncbi:membrane proteins related to metalloendopeptidases [Anaerolinea thermolimosa]|uniref:M23 family metallopeptidase n=1 Tax=Anaerolinea thermolimosa TaxID=229919 RepID=UPI0007846185|nr:peptidoglycan DD-metalloendopeptidase family protein [Anaerolinea thermolimosa]GAP06084.1 membrane proteins related to metalloendopeptidases [Anaerolinea thermolimosa]